MWTRRIFWGSKARGSTLLVLLALADGAGKPGLCMISAGELSRRAKLSVRQVRRDLALLLATGEIEQVSEGGGRGKAATYRVLVPWKGSFEAQDRAAKRAKKKAKSAALKGDSHITSLAPPETVTPTPPFSSVSPRARIKDSSNGAQLLQPALRAVKNPRESDQPAPKPHREEPTDRGHKRASER